MIISNQLLKVIEEIENNNQWNELDSKLIVELCNSVLDSKSKIHEKISVKYPFFYKKIDQITSQCSCKKYDWSNHLCPHDIGKVDTPSLCNCCPFCRVACFKESLEEKKREINNLIN